MTLGLLHRARIVAPAALVTVALCDALLTRDGVSLPVQGALDETALLSTTVLLLLGLALRLNDRVFVGTALAASVLIETDHVPGGVESHLLRDLATGPGVPLLWPVSDTSATVPYPAYAVVLAALCLAALLRSPAAEAASGPAASPSRP